MQNDDRSLVAKPNSGLVIANGSAAALLLTAKMAFDTG